MLRLEKVANVVLILASVAILAALAEKKLNGGRKVPERAWDLRGKELKVAGLTGVSQGLSIVVALSPGCKYCVESIPFYRKLSERHEQSAEKQVSFAVISSSSVGETTRFLSEHGIKADKIITAELFPLGISITPTVLVVDGNGIVQKVFRGKLRESIELEVLRIVEENAL